MDWKLQSSLRNASVRPKAVGVAEAFGIAGVVLSILRCLQRVSSLLSGDSQESNRNTVKLLMMRLNSETYKFRGEPPAPVVTGLRQSEEIARKLEKRASFGLPRRMLTALVKGRLEKQVDKLRKGLDDIEKSVPHHVSHSVASSHMSQMHTAQAPAPAPHPQNIKNFVFNGPVTFNVIQVGDQATIGLHDAPAVPVVAYPPATPTGYPPKIRF